VISAVIPPQSMEQIKRTVLVSLFVGRLVGGRDGWTGAIVGWKGAAVGATGAGVGGIGAGFGANGAGDGKTGAIVGVQLNLPFFHFFPFFFFFLPDFPPFLLPFFVRLLDTSTSAAT